MKPALGLSITAVAVCIGSTSLIAAPQQLMNKTITLSFSVSIPARSADGSTLTTNRQSYRQIYVSSQGRVFVKVLRKVKGHSQQKEIGPGEGSGGSLRFVGDRMVGVLSLGTGASQLTISFDPSFQSCTTNVIVGAQPGKPMVWKGLDGKTYTSTGKPSVSTPSCSISQGNALAG